MSNTANQVDNMISQWKREGLKKPDLAVKIAQACIGWPYIYGDRGQYCTSVHRQAVYNEHTDQTGLLTKCQKLSRGKDTCIGCQYFPGGQTRAFDCRGFTYWVLKHCDVSIMGAGATSQYNDNNNWERKGPINEMPMDRVCCVFKYSAKSGKMEHTGLHIGGGKIIHCSNGVQTGKTTDKGWTHYALPNGLEGTVPAPDPDPERRPTLKRGATGEYVKELQDDLLYLGYDVGKTGSDGKFGPNTEIAVRKFQKEHDLVVDGIVGKSTYEAIDKAMKEKPTPEPTVKSYCVIISHLDKTQATALCNAYPNAEMKEE